MKKMTLAIVLLLLPVIAGAEVYRWIDAAGNIHYGDTPPKNSDSQAVAVPQSGKSEAAARQDKEVRGEPAPADDTAEAPPPDGGDNADANRPVCFSQLSREVRGPSARSSAPISPDSLNTLQQETLAKLFARADALWYGTMIDMTCNRRNTAATIRNYTVTTALGLWDDSGLRYTLESEVNEPAIGVSKRLIHQFHVGDAFYFTDIDTNSIALEGNKMELVTLSANKVRFLGKRHFSTGATTSKARAELRTLEQSGATLKLNEYYYNNSRLSGARTWTLQR